MGTVRIVYYGGDRHVPHEERQLQIRVLEDGLAAQIQRDDRQSQRLLLSIARYASRAAGIRPETVLNLDRDDKENLFEALEGVDAGRPVTLQVWQAEYLLGNGPYHQATLDLLDELSVLMAVPSLLGLHSLYLYFPRRDLEQWLCTYAPDWVPIVRRLADGVA